MTRTNADMTRQELGQLHCLTAQLHHHLTWQDTRDPAENKNTDEYEFDLITPDWSHLHNTPDDERDYTPDLDEYNDTGVTVIDFLADQENMKNAVLELTGAIADELKPDQEPTAPTPEIETGEPSTDTATAQDPQPTDPADTNTQTRLTAYA